MHQAPKDNKPIDVQTADTLGRMTTVVIPVFNRADQVQRTVKSFFESAAKPRAMILVDNNSTDGTLDALKRLKDSAPHQIKVTVLQQPLAGACNARNLGLQHVRTPWVMFFDSDDIVLHTKDADGNMSFAPFALKDSQTDGIDLLGWDAEQTDTAGKILRRMPFESHIIRYHNLMHGTLATQRYMVRTAIARQAGGWDAAIPVWNDIEFGARILSLEPRVAKFSSKQPQVCVTAQPQSITGPSFGHDPMRFMPALHAIAKALPPGLKSSIYLKQAILAADVKRNGNPMGKELLDDALHRAGMRWRFLLHFAYLYRRAGGRGCARLLKPFFCR